MAETTLISWCHSTWSSWIGCTKVSTADNGGGACDHCYAAALNNRFSGGSNWGPGAPRRRTSDANWKLPRSWQRNHEKFFAEHGCKRSVFLNNQADILDNEVDDSLRNETLQLVEETPDLIWLLLTKRIGNARKMLPAKWLWPGGNGWPKHVRLGITLCNQMEVDRDLPKLLALQCPNFVSIEPLLGPVDLSRVKDLMNDIWYSPLTGEPIRGWRAGYPPPPPLESVLQWCIVGAESGPGARPLELEWVRRVVEQCVEAGVKVHVKQLGAVVLDRGMSSPGQHWPSGTKREERVRHGANDPAWLVRLKHPKGGDPAEWPDDLRRQDFPQDITGEHA